MLTREEFEQLQPFEADFVRAVKAKYKLPTPASENKIIETILRKYEPKERFNWSCGACALRVYTRMGWRYFEYKGWLEEQKEKKEKDEVLSTGGTAKVRKSSRKQNKQLS